jgi:hypothetical protein
MPDVLGALLPAAYLAGALLSLWLIVVAGRAKHHSGNSSLGLFIAGLVLDEAAYLAGLGRTLLGGGASDALLWTQGVLLLAGFVLIATSYLYDRLLMSLCAAEALSAAIIGAAVLSLLSYVAFAALGHPITPPRWMPWLFLAGALPLLHSLIHTARTARGPGLVPLGFLLWSAGQACWCAWSVQPSETPLVLAWLLHVAGLTSFCLALTPRRR